MKKVKLAVSALILSLTCISCGTLFTSSNQNITFTGEQGIKIYDQNRKIAEIGKDGTGTTKLKKRLSSKTLIAKKDGYKNTPFQVDATFNPVSIINLLNPLAWAIDLGTGKCCKWDTEIIEIEMNENKQ